MGPARPRPVGPENPAGFVGFGRNGAGNRTVIGPIDADRVTEQRVVERPGERDGERVARARSRRADLPVGGRQGQLDGQADAHLAAIALFQRLAARVAPGRVDDDRVAPAIANGTPELDVRQNPALHASRIEEHREPGVVVVPEIRVHLQKHVRQRLPLVVDEAHESNRAAARHRGGEVNVKAQQVLGPGLRRRRDGGDDRGRLQIRRGKRDRRVDDVRRSRRRQPPGIEANRIRPAAIERKPWTKFDRVAFDEVLADDGRLAAADTDAEERRPRVAAELRPAQRTKFFA